MKLAFSVLPHLTQSPHSTILTTSFPPPHPPSPLVNARISFFNFSAAFCVAFFFLEKKRKKGKKQQQQQERRYTEQLLCARSSLPFAASFFLFGFQFPELKRRRHRHTHTHTRAHTHTHTHTWTPRKFIRVCVCVFMCVSFFGNASGAVRVDVDAGSGLKKSEREQCVVHLSRTRSFKFSYFWAVEQGRKSGQGGLERGQHTRVFSEPLFRVSFSLRGGCADRNSSYSPTSIAGTSRIQDPCKASFTHAYPISYRKFRLLSQVLFSFPKRNFSEILHLCRLFDFINIQANTRTCFNILTTNIILRTNKMKSLF